MTSTIDFDSAYKLDRLIQHLSLVDLQKHPLPACNVNAKGAFLMWIANAKAILEYKVIQSGPPHQSTFTAMLYINNLFFAIGTAARKTEAEKEATWAAIRYLQDVLGRYNDVVLAAAETSATPTL